MKRLLAPLVIGVAAWCAAGTLSVVSASSATARLVLPAPWWVFIAGALAAAAVPGFRRDPRLALPALVSTVPWWPVPLPAIALFWTGPMAWVPVGIAVAAAVGAAPLRWASRQLEADRPAVGTVLAAVLAAAAASYAARAAAPVTPAGDEPNYLIITQSLLKDHDLQIENNHANRDYAAYVRR